MNNIVLNSQQISLNINQQAIAIQQVVSAMNDLNIAARENATGISQIRSGTRLLAEVGKRVRGKGERAYKNFPLTFSLSPLLQKLLLQEVY